MPRPRTDCDVDALFTALKAVGRARRVVVAYSGGLDSHVLLHLLTQLRDAGVIDLSAAHVDHGLQAQAKQWCGHCRQICDALAVPLQVVAVDARPRRGESPEAAARRVRYEAFAALLQPDQELATAHTEDDQAETLLLRLLRGSGVEGAAGIQPRRRLGTGWVIRPLLGFSKSALRAYAERAALQWIEDPSNLILSYDRNFVRQRVMPLLEQRWPAAAATLARDATNFRDAADLLRALAQEDLSAVSSTHPEGLSMPALERLPAARRRAVVRLWLRETAGVTPSQVQLDQLLDMPGARPDGQPCVRVGSAEVRRYRDTLLLRGSGAPADAPSPESPPGPSTVADCALPLTPGQLAAMGLSVPEGAAVELRYRCGGERIRLAGHAHSKSLKKLFQEHAIPPWQRNLIPLIYIDGRLAAVPGIGVAAEFSDGE